MRIVLVAVLFLTSVLYSGNDITLLNGNRTNGSKEVLIRGNGEQCKILVNRDNIPVKTNCLYLTNSKKVQIFCTKTKKICKTVAEVYEVLLPAYSPQGLSGVYKVMPIELNIRNKPSKESNILGTAKRGMRVNVYEFSGQWAKTKLGWMNGKYLRLVQPKTISSQHQTADHDSSSKIPNPIVKEEPPSNNYTFSSAKSTKAVETLKEKPLSNTYTFTKTKIPDTSTEQKQIPSTKVIVVTGYGINKDKALKGAFKAAVEQYVGVLVDADAIVKNGKMIKDEILTASNGYIQSYDELSVENNNGLVEVKIKATVKSQKVFDKIKSLNIATVMFNDSKNIYARVVSKNTAKQDAAKILKKSLDDFLSKKSIKEMMILGITDVKVNDESVKDNKVSVIISYVMEFNKKVYTQKVKKLEQTFDGLGAKLQERVDLPYLSKKKEYANKLQVKNRKKVQKLENTDFGFVKYYGNGYKLDAWKFPNSWSDIYPFNLKRSTSRNRRNYLKESTSMNWRDYYNIILEIKRKNGEVLVAENLTTKKRQEYGGFILKTNIRYSNFYQSDGFEEHGRVKVISPFFYQGRIGSVQKISKQTIIWIDVEDIKDLGSISIELDEI